MKARSTWVSTSEVREMKRRAEAGESIFSIARAMGRAHHTVKNYTFQPAHKPVDAREQERMLDRVRKGQSRREIARNMSRSLTCVQKYTRGVKSEALSFEKELARDGMRTRALRLERLFRSCIKALESHS